MGLQAGVVCYTSEHVLLTTPEQQETKHPGTCLEQCIIAESSCTGVKKEISELCQRGLPDIIAIYQFLATNGLLTSNVILHA